MVASSSIASMAILLAVMSCGTSSSDPLLFPKEKFSEKKVSVSTSKGKHEVVYRSYGPVAYVANPVDKDYQSLTVKVPVSVDGVKVDATNAPILLDIGVGGYMSVKASRSGFGGGPGGAPPGGMGGPGGQGGPPGGMGAPPDGVGGPGGQGGPPGGMGGPGGQGGPPSGMGGPGSMGTGTSGRTELALAAGFVVVTPGVRGRDNQASDGTYYGKAPAAIVDLKAAVRYIRHNAGVLPGNPEWIVSAGSSAGGALSALLGASGDSALYDSYLKELGAADAKDSIYGSADFCPITDLDHADAAYEWMFGSVSTRGSQVDQTLSQELKALFAEYQASLKLQGKDGFGALTADNYSQYLLKAYLYPSAKKYLSALSDEKRQAYLGKNSWIKYAGDEVSFSFADYAKHCGRSKALPAFDDFNASRPEPILFGSKTTNARHFTEFSLKHGSGDANAKIDSEVQAIVKLMNPIGFIVSGNKGCASHWWIRHGSSDSDTSLPVIVNLATSLENQKKDVNALLYWDGHHGADNDPEDFVAWILKITGYKTAN